MVLYQLRRALLPIAILTAASACLGSSTTLLALTLQDEEKPKLPIPFNLKAEEWRAGNTLARYAELARMEKEYVADEMWRSTYWQARGTIAAYLGDTLEADRDWNSAYAPFVPSQVLLDTPLSKMRAENAVDVISRAADTHRWIMFGEEHLKPQTRTIIIPVLRNLWKKGFRYFAAETFNENVEEIAKGGYPTLQIGTYTADPVFSAGVREAIRLGFKLVPYEDMSQPKEPAPAGDTEYMQNHREHGQAAHLKERIFDKDPQAKVIVWAGRAHVLERTDKDPNGSVWKPMAYEFKQLTGVDPFSVYLGTYTEQSSRPYERSEYKWATDRGLVKRPTIFSGADGKLFGDDFDVEVFFPRTTIVEGRQDWLLRELDRRLIPIPTGLVKPKGLQLAQVFAAGEQATAVAVDQILIHPGDPVPSLALPKGKFWIRVIDPAGAENGRRDIEVR